MKAKLKKLGLFLLKYVISPCAFLIGAIIGICGIFTGLIVSTFKAGYDFASLQVNKNIPK